MADPRDRVVFDSIGALYVTYKTDNSTIVYDATKANGSASAGLAVTLSADGTVALCADADEVIGKLITVSSDNKASVQTSGYMLLPGGDGATLTVGSRVVGDLGAASAKGYIRDVAASGEEASASGRIHDKSDTAAVVVKL